jgi:hypothetical protein
VHGRKSLAERTEGMLSLPPRSPGDERSCAVLTSLISTRNDSQLFVNGTKVTATASGTFVACAARL